MGVHLIHGRVPPTWACAEHESWVGIDVEEQWSDEDESAQADEDEIKRRRLYIT